MKTIAMYLPQFHRVQENDEWWGEGFTEWTAVKAATPLFEGHKQPKEPLDANYYDLLDDKTLEWQAEIAKRYGIGGFCFYHYYFENGRKILEKPIEKLRQSQKADIPFCLCWANETWARSWNKLGQYNAWADKFENENLKNEKSILLQQNYGRENQWKEHFYYLLPYFKDERYIRNKKGELIFLIYKPMDIYCLAEMTELWRKLAKEENIGELCLLGLNLHNRVEGIDAILINGPGGYISKSTKTVVDGVNVYDYSEVWSKAIEATKIEGIDTYYGGFQNYDDTPRRGNKGTVLLGATPEIFEDYFRKLVNKNYSNGNEFTFINAWNEWGEGMHLEPDSESKYAYLEAVYKVMKEERIQQDNEIGEQNINLSLYEDKYYRYYQLLNKWMHIRDEKRSVVQYFLKHHYLTIAIYGMGGMGNHLIEELKESPVTVDYTIDKESALGYSGIEHKSLQSNLKDVDAIIVTPIYYFNEIRSELKKKVGCSIISLEEVIEESLY